jgi:hypothetical protein
MELNYKELMIGNVLLATKSLVTVEEVKRSEVIVILNGKPLPYPNYTVEKYLQPVKITSEILNMIKEKPRNTTPWHINPYLTINKDSEGYTARMREHIHSNFKVYYLHQLQNLYFAVMGEHLDVSGLFVKDSYLAMIRFIHTEVNGLPEFTYHEPRCNLRGHTVKGLGISEKFTSKQDAIKWLVEEKNKIMLPEGSKGTFIMEVVENNNKLVFASMDRG